MLTSSTPCPHYLCLNMPRLSCVSLWVRYLSCFDKHPASVAAKLPVCPSPPAPLSSLLPGAVRSVLFLCWDALGITSSHPRCRVWVRQVGPESHPPLPWQQPRRRVAGGGGASVGCARAHARLSTRPCARPAPPAQRSERLSLPLSAPWGRCPSKLGVLSAGPLAPRQEDEFEEDAWAREYRDGCGPGGNRTRAEDGFRADDPPCGWLRTLAWYRHPDPTGTAGSPSPSPHRREGRRGK